MRLTKTFLLFFLLINIVYVTFAPNSIRDEGQTSGSKVNVEEEEEEEILNERFKLDLQLNVEEEEDEANWELQLCKMEIFTAFQPVSDKLDSSEHNRVAFDNFCEGLLNINEDSFNGIQSRLTSTAHSYYYDLLDTLPKLNLPPLISPKAFCDIRFSKNAKRCTRLIQHAGCHADADGIACIRHLYIHWKLRDRNTTTRPVPGTRDLSDKVLKQLYFRGYENPSEFEDEVLLQEYYKKHRHLRMSEDDIWISYQIHQAEVEDPHDFETYRNEILQAGRDNLREFDLGKARLEKYGVPDVSYYDLCRVTEFYDNHYANFLIDEIKKYDCSQFKSPKEYCMEEIETRRQGLGF